MSVVHINKINKKNPHTFTISTDGDESTSFNRMSISSLGVGASVLYIDKKQLSGSIEFSNYTELFQVYSLLRAALLKVGCEKEIARVEGWNHRYEEGMGR